MITIFFKNDYLSEKSWQVVKLESHIDAESFLKVKNKKFGRWFHYHQFEGEYNTHPKWIILRKFAPGLNYVKSEDKFVCEEVDPSKIAFYSNPEAHKAFRYFWMGETQFEGVIAAKKSWWNKRIFSGGEEEPIYNDKAPSEFIEIARRWFSSSKLPTHWTTAS